MQLAALVSSSPLEARVLGILTRFLSPINAGVLADRGRRVLADRNHLTEDEWPRFLAALRSGGGLFLGARALAELEAALHAEFFSTKSILARDIPVSSEEDLRLARSAAREMALALGSSSLCAQRIATAVSELGRNIVSYTPGGSIRLEPRSDRLRIVASDRGNGIAHLDAVLSGAYRSKTGLGRGLLGVRRMMDHFDIETGPQGTRITVEASL